MVRAEHSARPEIWSDSASRSQCRCDERQEKVSTLAALLNSIGLLAVLKYQSVHPEWAFRALLAMGTIELLLGILPVTRRRRTAFLILATIGVTLLVAAMPFHFTGGRGIYT